MAAATFISSFTELSLLNTTLRQGLIILPSTTTIPGRILTFKDTTGTLFNSTITFSTAGGGQIFENGTTRQTFNDPLGSYTFAAGNDNEWYTIGGSYMNAASISSITTQQLRTFNTLASNITTSTLQIRDFSLGSTTTTFYQSSILYYSSASGSFIWGGTKAPIALQIRPTGRFLPNQVTTLGLWLDAADPNTITTSGVSVTNWLDKSGNNRHAGVGVAVTTPTFQQAVLNGLPNLLNTGNSGLRGTFPVNTLTNMFIFVVANNTSAAAITNNTGGYLLWWNETASWGQVQFFVSQTRLAWRFGTGQVNNNPTVDITSVGTSYNIVMISKVGTAETLFLNGTNVGNFTAANTTISATDNTYVITGPITANPTLYGTNNIAEILIYTTNISASQQLIEGYLAWKWGLVAKLPLSHPYRFNVP